MRIVTPLLLSLCLSVPFLSARAEEMAPDVSASISIDAVLPIMEKAVDAVIRPGYRNFQASAHALTTAMNGLCAAPDEKALTAARAAFANTIEAWSRIEIVRIGPVIEHNRFERILFYPDRKGTGLKQVLAILATPDEKDTTPAGIAGKSVAVQGLGALEYILDGNGAEAVTAEPNSYRCRYGAAVAGNIESVAAEISAAWEAPDGMQASWKHPGPDNPEFRTGSEALSALLGILVHGAETVRDQRLETFYKGDPAAARPNVAVYRRSGNTWASVTANLEGLQTLWTTSGMRDLLSAEQAPIATSIDAALAALIEQAPTINADIAAALADDAERAKIDALLTGSKDLIFQLNDKYGAAIGLGAGFSFADGD